MFNISFAEFIVILLISFLVLGPDEMVKIARFCGRAVRKGRVALGRIKSYVNEETEDLHLDEVKRAAEDLEKTVSPKNISENLKKDMTDELKKN